MGTVTSFILISFVWKRRNHERGQALEIPVHDGGDAHAVPLQVPLQNAWVYRAWVLGLGVTFPIMCYVTYKQGGHKGIRYPPPAERRAIRGQCTHLAVEQ